VSRPRRTARAALTTAALATAALRPDLLRLDARFPVVTVAAFRPHLTVGLAALATLLAAPRRTRPWAAGLAAAALAAVPSWVGRALRRPPVPTGGDLALTVLAANVLVGRADAAALATLLERERPDLVALPEAGPDYRDKLEPLVSLLGYRAWASTAPGTSDGEGVVLLAGARVGDVTVTTGPELRHRWLRATGGLLGERSFFAVHPEAPMGPGRTAFWRGDLAQIGRWCREEPAPIVAGDLNATLDHSALRAALGGCRTAVDGLGNGLTGTFPATAPAAVGLQIDHVLVPVAARVTSARILEIPGSDHRAVLADVSLPPLPGVNGAARR
jgi:endonuclease/exonuclease/phosphatase (EEP) superfamily protein YafD